MSDSTDSEVLVEFADDGDDAYPSLPVWRVLVVDDEPDIFRATDFSLRDVEIDGRRIELLQARSAAEGRHVVEQQPDIAVVLLDVVMETPDAGLVLVEALRGMNDRQALRIILRTGQPGYAPELEVIRRYDINDYKTKAELTHTRLLTALTVAIRGYHHLRRIEAHQQGLEKVVAASGTLLTERGSLQQFADGVLTQICSITAGHADGVIVVRTDAGRTDRLSGPSRIVAAAGSFSELVGRATSELPDAVQTALGQAVSQKQGQVISIGAHCAVVVHAADGDELMVVFSTTRPLDDLVTRLLCLFASNIALAFDGLKIFKELEHFAHHDRETGLLNRSGLIQSVREQGLSFAQIVMSELHELRGALGETLARQVLTDLGRRLVELLGDDGLVARIHGDRFALALLKPVDARLTQALHELLSQPVRVGGMALQLPVAVGWSHGANGVDQGIDEAGLVANRPGSGRQLSSAVFAEAIRDQVRARLALLSDLPQALQEGRIEMHLQPQVRLSDLAVIGDEALVRWRQRDGSMAMPNNFIPLLEHTGGVVPLGQRMLELAVQHLLADAASVRRISVNLSVRQLEEPDFSEWLIEHCDRHGLARERLRLEVTESAFALDAEQVGAALAQLAQAGFELSIDDFGTGQSSLGRLAEVQVRELKLDRSLVSGIERDARARRVAGLVVELGRDLGVDVLAEGIETEGQLAVLRELGCALGQGWLFGRPVPSSQPRLG